MHRESGACTDDYRAIISLCVPYSGVIQWASPVDLLSTFGGPESRLGWFVDFLSLDGVYIGEHHRSGHSRNCAFFIIIIIITSALLTVALQLQGITRSAFHSKVVHAHARDMTQSGDILLTSSIWL